jgi:hypothetical protein
MTTARDGQTATLLQDGRVLIAGGAYGSGTVLTSAELYDPTTGTFSPTGSMVKIRHNAETVRLLDGRVLIVGGDDGCCVPATAEIYDPTTGSFSATGSLANVADDIAGDGAATLLQDGRVLIAGGTVSANGGGILASAELYDPKTGQFTATGSMAVERWHHSATLLQDGRVLVAGGQNSSDNVRAELYDPKTATFSSAGVMTDWRNYQSATLLQDGRVFVAGGNNPGSLSSAEIYAPNTETFTQTGSMATTRGGPTATLLQDGRVLVVGGVPSLYSKTSLSSAELYDPKTGTFRPAGSMSTARAGFTATLLKNGQVLIAGGVGATDALSSAELYQP